MIFIPLKGFVSGEQRDFLKQKFNQSIKNGAVQREIISIFIAYVCIYVFL